MKLMTDIETLSSRNDGAVIAIGLCVFDDYEIIDSMEILIDPVLAIGHRDPRTIKWWWEQDDAVRMKMFSGKETPWGACELFKAFCLQYKKADELWANPPQFDLILLRHLFDECEVKFPMHYRTERCFRTFKASAHKLHIDYQSAYEGISKHDAKDDAIAQARAVQLIIQALRGEQHG